MNEIVYDSAYRIVVVWWKGKRYEGTWRDIYHIIRRDVSICADCKAEYLGLERVRGVLVCKGCREK